MEDLLIKYQNYTIRDIVLILENYESMKHDYELIKKRVVELEIDFTELKNNFRNPSESP